MPRPKAIFLLWLAILLAPVLAAHAQTADLSERLPADTVFYAYWGGAAALGEGHANALIDLWNDPGFAPVRQLFQQALVDAATRNPSLAHIPADRLQALLSNPLLIGFRPEPRANGESARRRTFLVLAAQGRAAEIARAALADAGPAAVPYARLTPSGYLVISGDPSTLKELVERFDSKPPVTTDTLASVPAYRDVREELGGRLPVEFFVRVPDLAEYLLQKPSRSGRLRSNPNFDTAAFFRALHLERVHAICGGLDLSSATSPGRLAILGDTSSGSVFDFFGGNVTAFPTLAVAPAGASISITRLDLDAIASILGNAASAAMSPDQAAKVKMVIGLLSTSVISAFGGEYATIWTNPQSATADASSVFAATIRQSDATKQLFDTTLAPFLRPVGQQGQIRYFRAIPRQTAAGNSPNANVSIEQNFLAVTPGLLLGGKDEQFVRSRAGAVASGAAGLGSDPRFLAARSDFPERLSGLSYFDLERFDWSKWIERTASRADQHRHSSQRTAEFLSWGRNGGTAVLSRHLHEIIIASWKDSSGIHWRSSVR